MSTASPAADGATGILSSRHACHRGARPIASERGYGNVKKAALALAHSGNDRRKAVRRCGGAHLQQWRLAQVFPVPPEPG